MGFSHPLILVGVLTLQTIAPFFLVYSIIENIWIIYIVFLIFLGGLLIIFVYLSALIPNEIIIIKNPLPILILLSIIIIIIRLRNPYNYNVLDQNEIRRFSHEFRRTLLISIILYLLASLFSIIFLCEKRKSPAKSNSYDFTKTCPLIKNCQLSPSRSPSP